MSADPIPDDAGTLERYPDFASRHVLARHVEVWCPPGYADNPAPCPVLYMHDGQNLFNAFSGLARMPWGIGRALTGLIQHGQVPPTIVVGVWHPPQRWIEYMPAQPLTAPEAQALRQQFIETQGGLPVSDGYLQFLVEELKPFIDSHYRTQPDQAHTAVMGSSMGGLISLYALLRYPQVFGGAGCVSTHWVAGGDLLVDALAATLPAPGQHRLYFDYGTAGKDAAYEPWQQRMDTHLRARGYTPGRDWVTRKFPGADHSEVFWSQRVSIPLTFLLAKR